MSASNGIRWGRVLLGGFLVELALTLLSMPLFLLGGFEAVLVVIAPLCFIVAFLVSWWILRRAPSRGALHGFLIGVVTTVIYLGLNFAMSGSLGQIIEMYGPLLFFLANGLRVAGAIAGGAFAQRSVSEAHRIPMHE